MRVRQSLENFREYFGFYIQVRKTNRKGYREYTVQPRKK